MKQKIGNACGTFSVLHSLANLKDKVDIGDGKFAKWLKKASLLGIEERSKSLEDDQDMAQSHDNCARSGETDIGDGNVEHHFITYLNIDGTLYEIDSQFDFARPIGPTTQETMFKDVGKLVQELSANLENASFSAIALVGDN